MVEVRLGGVIKRQLRDIIQDVADRFDERELVRSHYVPHITLYGPCRVTNEKVALARIRDVCSQYDLVPFRIAGFDQFDRSTIYADVHSSYALRKLRYELSQELHAVTDDEPAYDHDRWCEFHSTIARNIGTFDEIWEWVTSEYEINHEGYVERVTLIRDGNIVKEYSLPQARFLNSDGATAKPAWKRDETLIERYRRPGDHENLIPSQPGSTRRWRTMIADWLPTTSLERRRNTEFADRPPKTFVSGDLHLNHGNIIEYCNRPFRTVHEMNQQIVANWNDTVGPDDTVVFLGDLAFYYGDLTTHDWVHALNGDIVYIRGNHDEASGIDYEDEYVLETENQRYYCTHRPGGIPENWKGWAIHGHVHNNDVDNHPFLDSETKRINAAPELMEYSPVALADIEAAIGSSTEAHQTSSDLPNADDGDRPVSQFEPGKTPYRPIVIWLLVAGGVGYLLAWQLGGVPGPIKILSSLAGILA